MKKKLEKIAQGQGVETLEVRNSDSLDFHDIGVLQLKSMLEAAYKAGEKASSTVFVAAVFHNPCWGLRSPENYDHYETTIISDNRKRLLQQLKHTYGKATYTGLHTYEFPGRITVKVRKQQFV